MSGKKPGESTHYCASCRKDMQDCHCPTTLSWRERAWAKREREAAEGDQRPE